MLLPCSTVPHETDPMHDAFEDLKDHLLIAPLPVWLDVLRRTDPDDHLELIRWMIAQPECDLTLAQFAFYRCRPRLALHELDGRSPALIALAELCAEITERYNDGAYTQRRLTVRVGEISQQILALTAAVRNLPKGTGAFAVPSAFLEDIEGIPSEVEGLWSSDEDHEIHALYENAGLSVHARPYTPTQPTATTSTDNSVLLAFTDMLLRPRTSTP